jgi:ESS family glutamate:Na+ symporter
VGVLDRFNIPAPVVGGFLFAATALALRQAGILAFEFDSALQTPFMVAFFTTIGLGASVGLLRVGGPQVLLFWGLASFVAAIQNGVGIGLARALGVDPLLGLLTGSITMTGGHGTGAAFGKLLEEQYAFPGAVTLAMAAATFGLVSGGLIGGPVSTWLIRRRDLRPDPTVVSAAAAPPVALAHAALDEEIDTEPAGEAPTAYTLLKTLTIILVAMWAGSLLSAWLGRYVTLPGYIGAMLCAAVLRNVADATKLVRIEQRTVDDLGTIALSLFLAMALMSLKLWELLDLALPMFVILAVQVLLMAAFAAFVTYRVMGRDYEAAVMAGGHCGFGLGATPNAVANMTSIIERFGPAPRALLVLPMVGAFFIDFTNALIITTYINLVR